MAAVLALVKASWPHGVTEDLARGYWEYLGDLEALEVGAAVRELALTGREFPPPPGVVHATVHHGADRKPAEVARERANARVARSGSAVVSLPARLIRRRALPSPPHSSDTLDA